MQSTNYEELSSFIRRSSTELLPNALPPLNCALVQEWYSGMLMHCTMSVSEIGVQILTCWRVPKSIQTFLLQREGTFEIIWFWCSRYWEIVSISALMISSNWLYGAALRGYRSNFPRCTTPVQRPQHCFAWRVVNIQNNLPGLSKIRFQFIYLQKHFDFLWPSLFPDTILYVFGFIYSHV